jgi:hypothetical protein
VLDRGIRQQRRDGRQVEVQLAAEEDPLQPAQVLVPVEAVVGGTALARLEQPDLVVVVQRPHRHADQLGHRTHRVLVHDATVRPHVA